MNFFKRLFMSEEDLKINAVANVIGYKNDGGIKFLRENGKMIGIWVRAFPSNTTKKYFLQMYCVKEEENNAYKSILSSAYKIIKSKSGKGFDILFE